MKHIKLIIISIFMLSLEISGLHAQETITTTGNSISGSGGTASFTVGQVFYKLHSGTSGSIIQGVQQPFEISVISGINQTTDINLTCSAYPNPATEFVKLTVKNYKDEAFSYQLYDICGKLLEDKQISGSETTIYMTKLVPAVYLLRVQDGYKEVKTFKIIKTQ